MTKRISRREVLRSITVAGAGICVGAGVRSSLRAEAPADKLNIAFVGAGGQAGFSLDQLASQNIVALSDVDDERAKGAYERFPKAQRFRDFRRMLDAVHRTIDAVVVATPDHIHAAASLAAMHLGKHVYCEKPLTWSIEEARRMAALAKEKKLATQMGTQGMAMDGARAGVEAVRSGVLGPVRELHVWTDRAKGWWPQGVGRPEEKPPVRAGLDWDLWLGPAPVRPYHSTYVPFRWRGWQDFGTGAVGDMGIHNAAMAWLGLELGAPKSAKVVATSGANRETFPEWSTLKLEFPARGSRPPVTMHWYDGGKKPASELIGGREVPKNGAILVGERGTMLSVEWTGADWHLLPEETFRDFQRPAATLPRVKSHHDDWLEACRGGRQSLCNFVDFAAGITEVMLVAALAQRLGRDIEWDAARMEAPGCPEAAGFIRREYRKGWEL